MCTSKPFNIKQNSRHLLSLQNPEQTQYKTNVQNSQQIILGSKTVWKKSNMHQKKKNFNLVNTASFNLLPVDNSSK